MQELCQPVESLKKDRKLSRKKTIVIIIEIWRKNGEVPSTVNASNVAAN